MRSDVERSRIALQLLEQASAILHCHAPMALLRERVGARERRGGDPSEAGVAVLERLANLVEPLDADEQARAIDADTAGPIDATALCRRWRGG